MKLLLWPTLLVWMQLPILNSQRSQPLCRVKCGKCSYLAFHCTRVKFYNKFKMAQFYGSNLILIDHQTVNVLSAEDQNIRWENKSSLL